MFLPKRAGTDIFWETSIHWKLFFFFNIVVSVKGIFHLFPTFFFYNEIVRIDVVVDAPT